MAYETIVAVFDNAERAAAAKTALITSGFHDDDISIFNRDRLSDESGKSNDKMFEPTLWNKVFGGGLHKHEASVYGQTVEEGGTVLSLRVLDSEVAHATGILELHHPIDVHDRAVTSGLATPAYAEAAETKLAAVPLAPKQEVAVTPRIAEAHGDVLRLAEEQLQVGKERVETGVTRVRRFTTEREVAEDVTLHEEHAEVIRRAISEPASLDTVDWSDSEIEVVETAEHALVSKTARVIEEVALRKVDSEHVETVHEKLRRQQADIEEVGAAGRPL